MNPKKLPRVELPPPAERVAREYTHARIPGTLKLQMITLARKLGETETEFLTKAIQERVERLSK